jgi:tRNA U34 5-carboxymethylaminomethyl modifying enzyme MnmG/GidA
MGPWPATRRWAAWPRGTWSRKSTPWGARWPATSTPPGSSSATLNTSKGPAVRSTRAQADKLRYRLRHENGAGGTAQPGDPPGHRRAQLLVEEGRVAGCGPPWGKNFTPAVIITTGTFLNGLIHIGLKQFPAGRPGIAAALPAPPPQGTGPEHGPAQNRDPPRLDGGSIDFAGLEAQDPATIPPSSFPGANAGQAPELPQLPCHITYTTGATHEIIRAEHATARRCSPGSSRGWGPATAPPSKTRSCASPTRSATR